MKKQLQDYKEVMAEQTAASLASSDNIDKIMNVPGDMLRMIATKVVAMNSSAIVMLRNNDGVVVCISGEKSKANALDFIKEKVGSKKFMGGGSAKFAEGKIV